VGPRPAARGENGEGFPACTQKGEGAAPGIGFGDYGDGHVRFSLIENEERPRQALRGMKQMFAKG
jgi:alanine-synthesizing transaminase